MRPHLPKAVIGRRFLPIPVGNDNPHLAQIHLTLLLLHFNSFSFSASPEGEEILFITFIRVLGVVNESYELVFGITAGLASLRSTSVGLRDLRNVEGSRERRLFALSFIQVSQQSLQFFKVISI